MEKLFSYHRKKYLNGLIRIEIKQPLALITTENGGWGSLSRNCQPHTTVGTFVIPFKIHIMLAPSTLTGIAKDTVLPDLGPKLEPWLERKVKKGELSEAH